MSFCTSATCLVSSCVTESLKQGTDAGQLVALARQKWRSRGRNGAVGVAKGARLTQLDALIHRERLGGRAGLNETPAGVCPVLDVWCLTG